MATIKQELAAMLNKALELEHMAQVQYLAHAELVKGPGAEEIIDRLKELAGDEKGHAEKFRNLLGAYLDAEPSMKIAPTHRAESRKDILKVNLANEREAIDFYKKIYRAVMDGKEKLPYEAETLEHDIRHVIIDEEEHVAELRLLLGE